MPAPELYSRATVVPAPAGLELTPPSLSVTVAPTVQLPAPTYSFERWVCAPWVAALYVVCVWPTPQSTSTPQGASLRPGSLNPKSSVTTLPARHAVPVLPASVSAPTDGATLLTVT